MDNNYALLPVQLADSNWMTVVAYAVAAVGTIADAAAVVEVRTVAALVLELVTLVSVEAWEVLATMFERTLVVLEPICCSRARCTLADWKTPFQQW